MPPDAPILVRCASCKWNFETHQHGQQECPNCHSEVFVTPPEGVDLPGDATGEGADSGAPGGDREEPAAPPDSREDAPGQDPDDPVRASTDGGDEMETLLRMIQDKLRKQEAETAPQPAWEQQAGNPVGRFLATVKQVLVSPARFFASLRVGGIRRPLIFGGILGTIGIFFFAAYGLWQLDRNQEELARMVTERLRDSGLHADPGDVLSTLRGTLHGMLYLSPLLAFLNVFVTAGLYHLGVLITGREHRGFRATFVATAYGFVPLLLAILPVFGLLAGGLSTLLLQMVALAHVHRFSLARGGLAVMLPVMTFMLLLLSLT